MPVIREYTQQTSPQGGIGGRRAQGSDIGNTGLVELGRGMSDLGDALHQRASQLEVTDAYSLLAKAQADWSLHLQERAQQTTPGDESFASQFNEDLKKYLDDTSGKFQTAAGQQTFARGAAQLSATFVEASGREQARLAGAKAAQDFGQTVDSFQVVVLNDPTQFDAKKSELFSILDDPQSTYSKIPAEHRAEIKQQSISQLASAALEGVIRTAPKLGKQMLENPQSNAAQYLTGEQLNSLRSKADTGIDRQATAKEREYQLEKRVKQDQYAEISTGFIQRILNPQTEGGMPSDKEIASSDLDGDHMRIIDEFKNQRASELAMHGEDKKHPGEVHHLLMQMIADGEDPKKTYNLNAVHESYVKGRLSTAEETFLEDRFYRLKDSGANSFERDMAAQMEATVRFISGSIYFTEQPGAAIDAIGRIRNDAYAKVEELRKANQNPRSILDPKSKDYFFSNENLSTYLMPPVVSLEVAAKKIVGEKNVMEFFNTPDPFAPAKAAGMPTYKEYDTLKSGDEYTDPDGVVRRKK